MTPYQFIILSRLTWIAQTFNNVLPRPQALPYTEYARKLGLIRALASKRYRDQHLKIAGAEAKVRVLIDEYVLAQGVDPKIPPLDILDAEFEDHVKGIESPRAKAAEMEFAIRYHIREHEQEDPVYYQRLSERLETILEAFAENWETQYEALRELLKKYRSTQENVSREEKKHQPFLRLLVDANTNGGPTPQERAALAQRTVELVEIIQAEIGQVDFWRKPVAREQLRGSVIHFLDRHELVPFEKQDALADSLVSTAKSNHTLLTGEML